MKRGDWVGEKMGSNNKGQNDRTDNNLQYTCTHFWKLNDFIYS